MGDGVAAIDLEDGVQPILIDTQLVNLQSVEDTNQDRLKELEEGVVAEDANHLLVAVHVAVLYVFELAAFSRDIVNRPIAAVPLLLLMKTHSLLGGLLFITENRVGVNDGEIIDLDRDAVQVETGINQT